MKCLNYKFNFKNGTSENYEVTYNENDIKKTIEGCHKMHEVIVNTMSDVGSGYIQFISTEGQVFISTSDIQSFVIVEWEELVKKYNDIFEVGNSNE